MTNLNNLTTAPLPGSHTKYVLQKGRATRMMKMLQIRGFTSVGGDITLHVIIKPVSWSQDFKAE